MPEQVERDVVELTCTILNGASLSNALFFNGKVTVALQMPAVWTAAAISFAGSNDGSTYVPVYDDQGTELSIAVGNALAARIIVDNAVLGKLRGLHSFKIRSGLVAAAVNQGADRVLLVTAKG